MTAVDFPFDPWIWLAALEFISVLANNFGWPFSLKMHHNAGAVSRVIKKLKMSDKLKVRQRTINGKKGTYIVRVA